MQRRFPNPLVVLLVLAVAACRPAGDEASQHDAAATSTDTGGAAAHPAAGHAAAGESGRALLPIMQQLGADMMALTHALMMDDYATVTQRSEAVAQHAPISAGELERIRGLLGADMGAFETLDESVHEASVRLHEAAVARRPALIADRLGEVQQGCVACHVQFRGRLRTTPGG